MAAAPQEDKKETEEKKCSVPADRDQPYSLKELNKKVIAKVKPPRDPRDILEPSYLYEEEYLSCFGRAKEIYKQEVKNFKRKNEMAILSKEPTKGAAVGVMDEVIRATECQGSVKPTNRALEGNGRLIRMRTQRKIHEEPPVDKEAPCVLEPWFKRYITMSRFAKVARQQIVVNRLLKRLEIFKTLDEETVERLESLHVKYDNVSYADLFQKFM